MTNSVLLEEKIALSGLKKDFIAKNIGITRQSLSYKSSNKSVFTAVEIAKLCDLLNIDTLEEKEAIFFASKVE